MLLFQLAAAADTVIVRQVPPIRSGFEQLVFIASGLTSLLTLLLVAAIVVALGVMRHKADALQDKLEELLVELRPMAKSAISMSHDVREVTSDVKVMVDDSRETVALVNTRVRDSVTKLTDRVDEVSAMLGRVNESAERVASVASTAVGGIKLGARAMGFGGGKKKKQTKVAQAAERPRLRRRD